MVYSVFKGAITEADGVTINVGYLSLFWVMTVVLTVVPFMCGLTVYAVVTGEKIVTLLPALGSAIGYVSGGFATILGALGVFIWGESRTNRSYNYVPGAELPPQSVEYNNYSKSDRFVPRSGRTSVDHSVD